ncbi:uncharacterized protein F4822DRAFT_405738 [Hypoxylon trugodes]|uniref:uncharacterized protein n=1 Tax=Hypoxylon trugodes TaxID=326681 RepID=UPI00219921A7|nr:uncharacterized protein F4822DRAFT_405738 [Hypoxylon trugodes]KAI1387206.1 hypothetical protein F4822DRAFT_405738 [Hypoxylon trugodes]
MPTPNQLNALLAMPVSLRLALIGASTRIRPAQTYIFRTSLRSYATSKYPNVAAFLIPEFRISQPKEILSEELFESFSISPAADIPLEDELSSLFTKNPPLFQYGESDFYKLKKNTRVPEVCILGRSNVGKSSFVNALAGRHSSALAYVSTKAGKTRAMNTYGFGPAPLPKDIAAQSAEYKGKEDIPTHAFYLVDMPGYGHASLKDWGRNIMLYLTKRVGVKGAIILIDAEVGPKQTDTQLLELLGSIGTRTAIVLTKADKVKGGPDGLRETCTKLWDIILNIEKKQVNNRCNWEKEIFVTAVGAKDRDVANSTVTTARLVVARLAGLVTDTRPKQEKNKKWSGKVISFDDLQYAPDTNMATTPRADKTERISPKRETSIRSSPSAGGTSSPFAELERASAEEAHRGPHRIRPRAFNSPVTRTTSRSHARAFHRSARSRDEEKSNVQSNVPAEVDLRSVLDEFIQQLKATQMTSSNYVRSMRLKQDRSWPLPVEKRNLLENFKQKQTRFLQKRFREDTARIEEVRQARLTKTEERAQRRLEKERERAVMGVDVDKYQPAKAAPSPAKVEEVDPSDEPMTADVFQAMVTSPELKEAKEEKRKKAKKETKKQRKERKKKLHKAKSVDEFEEKFANAFSEE